MAKSFRKSSFKTQYMKYIMVEGKNKPSKFATFVKTKMEVKESQDEMKKKIEKQKKVDAESRGILRFFG